MIESLFLEYYYTERGPGKVVDNLKKGLSIIGVTINETIRDSEYIGALQTHPDAHKPDYDLSPYTGKKCLMGPSCFLTPDEKPAIAKKFRDIVAPSEWIARMHRSYDELVGTVHIWSAGIDTGVWLPHNIPDSRKLLDCFIYLKNRDTSEFQEVCKQLDGLGLKYAAIQYDHYAPQQLYQLCQLSRFCIFLDNTESQGIAYMQMLSANLPLLVFNRGWYVHPISNVTHDATSVPYFDDRCGLIKNDIKADHIVQMMDVYRKFMPREYILENHTLETSAKKYVDILMQTTEIQ